MDSDDEGSFRAESLPDLLENFHLQGLIKIGEDDVPAQDQVKQAIGRHRADILFEEDNLLSLLRPDAEYSSRSDERLVQPVPWKFF